MWCSATRPATKCLFRSWLNSFLFLFFLSSAPFALCLFISLCSRGTSTHFSIFFFNFNTISSTSPFFYLRLPNYSHLFGLFFFFLLFPPSHCPVLCVDPPFPIVLFLQFICARYNFTAGVSPMILFSAVVTQDAIKSNPFKKKVKMKKPPEFPCLSCSCSSI